MVFLRPQHGMNGRKQEKWKFMLQCLTLSPAVIGSPGPGSSLSVLDAQKDLKNVITSSSLECKLIRMRNHKLNVGMLHVLLSSLRNVESIQGR